MTIAVEALIKILLAFLLGGLIGGEREVREKSAGFRTMILICLGATLFTMLSIFLGKGNYPPYIAANIVTGIGFLGAGAILREGNKITGLTTASSIWLTAAVGMAVGAGHYLLAAAVTIAALVVLWILPALETRIDDLRHVYTYEVVCKPGSMVFQQLDATFKQHGLKYQRTKRTKSAGQVTFTTQASGTPKAHKGLVEALLQDPDVLELTY